MHPYYITTQRRLDYADYWARVVWHQLQPVHIAATPDYPTDVRVGPLLTEHDVIEFPGRLKHYATCKAYQWAWDALHGYVKPLKDNK